MWQQLFLLVDVCAPRWRREDARRRGRGTGRRHPKTPPRKFNPAVWNGGARRDRPATSSWYQSSWRPLVAGCFRFHRFQLWTKNGEFFHLGCRPLRRPLTPGLFQALDRWLLLLCPDQADSDEPAPRSGGRAAAPRERRRGSRHLFSSARIQTQPRWLSIRR